MGADRLRTPQRALLRAVLAAALFGAAGAQAALFDDEEARKRIEEVRKQLDAVQFAVYDRLAKFESKMFERTAALELSNQIDALRTELAQLRGQIEVLGNRIDTGDKRQRDLYLDIDTRLRKLEQAQLASAAEKAAAPPAPDAVGDTKAYEAALNQFKLENYALAISAFQGFMVTYPASALAPSAQYWIGNAYYAQRDFKNAIASQQRLIAAWPDSAKVPDALLNIASSQEALGDRKAAQRTLESIVAKHPGTPAAANAKQRLQQASKKDKGR